ncbi:hypothetical protein AJ79_08484 [Helicocarpus griseus UAMH5409]|uniref:NmrA-like domain-containing protein n=1 Tax=Helicocarpus griseus UAMH5409 TaxID=1447875 RepID=A0A2B7WSV3_9EURO|nr:hypothetical protein AJ79_08484 [Helicocarpus griseus UAMH5409]
MAERQRVLLLGATGETGGSILEALLEAGQFDVEIMVRPRSAEKPAVKQIANRGIKVRVSDLAAPEAQLVATLSGIDTFISAIGADDLIQQKSLVRAAKAAGVKRFVPCAFITVAPPTGVMLLRDEKEVIYNEIKRLVLPYTVIDVGFWHQFSYPRLPSGRVDYAMMMPNSTIHGDGSAPNLLTDLRDVGPFVARIIADDRTLNKYIYTWSDVLSENEIFNIVEEMSGEKIEREYESAQEVEQKVAAAASNLAQNPDIPMGRLQRYVTDYPYSKYVRGDNQPSYAKYLGYLDARELYPGFKPISFRDFFAEVLAGKGRKPYSGAPPAGKVADL